MSLETVLAPVRKEHSIKEAVISLFLANPIIKPERFKTLIETDFKETFHQFETLSQFEVEFKAPPGLGPKINQQILPDSGFKFVSFSKGQAVRVLQGLNEKTRNYISYHALDYTRWANFYNDYKTIINSISKFNQELFVTAFSLHYIDQFYWVSGEVDLQLLFKQNGTYIPTEVFKSSLKNHVIISDKEDHGHKYIDRLDIKVEKNIKSSITISHNVTQQLTDVMRLDDLIAPNSNFETIINLCHQRNKDLLLDILTNEAADLIHLKPNSNGI